MKSFLRKPQVAFLAALSCGGFLGGTISAGAAAAPQILTPPAPATPRISNHDGSIVYAKTLADGSFAVGLFNQGDAETTIGVKWGPWGTLPTEHVGSTFRVRDLWRQLDLGEFKDHFETQVAPHGVVLIRLVPTN